MKQIIHRLICWWYATMVPEQIPPMTIEEREVIRKRRLFSIIVLLHILICAPWLLAKSAPYQQLILFVSLCIFLLSLLINRRGYLKIAGICYLLTGSFLMAISIVGISSITPATSFVMWSVLLVLLVIAGLLLPNWGALMLTGIFVLFMSWFILIERRSQILLIDPNPVNLIYFLFFSSMVIIIIGILSAISATITKRAVIQADRAVELEQAHQQISQAYAIIQRQALTDGLTDLPNHRAVVEQLEKEMERTRRHKRPLSILFFDADRFKQVNDTYGHAAGDTVLCQIGKRAGSILRKEDTLGRFGGEEFVILLPETDNADAEATAERIRAAVAASTVVIPEVPDGINVTVSIGLATYPIDGDDGEILLTAADEAMYIAKRMGRNQVRTAEESRQMSADVELMTLLEEEKKQDEMNREGLTLERLREAYTLKIVSSLTCLLERRDANMSEHAYAVSDLVTAIAQQMKLDYKQVSRMGIAALLHDIGKIAIPDMLLRKIGTLSAYEQTLIHDHAELGAQILEGSPFLSDLASAVRYHHEHWDGSGYPEHLAGENIPLAARIIAVAEAYDAMQREYPYRQRHSAEEALMEIQKRVGKQFDPEVVQSLSRYLVEVQTPVSVPQSVG